MRSSIMLVNTISPFAAAVEYTVGFDEQGKIQGVDYLIVGDCGYSPDLSDAIVDRAMFHCDNAYFLENANIKGLRCKTNTV